jgi:hypothetical protein
MSIAALERGKEMFDAGAGDVEKDGGRGRGSEKDTEVEDVEEGPGFRGRNG